MFLPRADNWKTSGSCLWSERREGGVEAGERGGWLISREQGTQSGESHHKLVLIRVPTQCLVRKDRVES